MKLSTINWLSRAIVLPLFIATANIAPASAERTNRSPRVEALPSVRILNLANAVTATIIDANDRQESMSVTPYWSNPRSTNNSKTVINERNSTAKSPSRVKRKLATIKIEPTTIVPASPAPLKSVLKTKKTSTKKLDISPEKTDRNLANTKNNSRRKLALASRSSTSGNYLKLVRSSNLRTNDIGNPIYKLETYIDGRRARTFNVVSGTANTQSIDRNAGNNFAPLPDGTYEVSDRVIPGMAFEVGETFIGIFPRFTTNRTGLGIHLDRSFNKRNGYDGTAGCIGITTLADRQAIDDFVTKYRPHSLFVSILAPSN
jgi:hypothetical protein